MLAGEIVCALVMLLTGIQDGELEEPDRNTITLIRFELKMHRGERFVIRGVTQRHLHRLGDRAAVALIKILDEQSLVNAKTVNDFLPIIEDAFAAPQLIKREADKKPQVTMALLAYVSDNITDIGTKEKIRQTIDFIKMQTAG